MAVTLKDVAAKAGVSIATASLVLNGRGEELKLSAGAIARVSDAAKRLGYRSNYHARTLKTGLSRTLGVVHPGMQESFLTNRFQSVITVGIDHEARANGYHLLLLGGSGGLDPIGATTEILEQRRIDALIVQGLTAPVPSGLVRRGVPIVTIGGPAQRGVSRVDFDPAPGLSKAVSLLHGQGHRRVLWVGATLNGREQNPERRQLIAREAAKLGMTVERWAVATDDYHPELERHIEVDRRGLAGLLPLPAGVTAVLCWNDTMALALVSLLVERGVRVPAECSVIGFDDLHASHVVPALTTVSHELRELGRQAVRLALARLGGSQPRTETVPSRLVDRASTAPTDRG
jgi:LacI family transcriptional regulator